MCMLYDFSLKVGEQYYHQWNLQTVVACNHLIDSSFAQIPEGKPSYGIPKMAEVQASTSISVFLVVST